MRLSLAELRAFTERLLMACGVPRPAARLAAAVLCFAETRGVVTHGMLGLVRIYAPGLLSGAIDPAARLTVRSRTGAVAVTDAGRGLGLVAASEAMELAVKGAAEHGITMVTVRNSTHCGCAGAYAYQAAAAGMIGIALTNCGNQGVVPPLGGARKLLGTNPIAAAVPAATMAPFVLDMATTAVASGKVNAARRAGAQVPPGWLVRLQDGSASTEPAEYADGLAELHWTGGHAITGGAKGFGLGLLVDLLCGSLAGAGSGPRRAALSQRHEDDDDIGHVLIALDPAAFGDPEVFTRRVDETLGTIADCPPAGYASRVAYPGLAEAERAAAAATEVALSDEAADGLRRLAAGLDVPVPGEGAR